MNSPALKNLSQIIAHLHSHENIAIIDDTIINGAQMHNHILLAIKKIDAINKNKIALFFNDSYHFSVALIAMLCRNKTPLILPNSQTDFINAIANEIEHILCDFNIDTKTPKTLITDLPLTKTSPQKNTLKINTAAELIIFTSGSTGKPKKITKTLSQLETEFLALETLWGKTLGASVIRSTVSHQHIYGLIFRLLWPLCSGRCFDATTYQYPEKLFDKIIAEKHNVLISSPAHLKRIPDLIDLRRCKSNLQMVFSSGGPLDTMSAIHISKQLDFPVTEVFGSSETGGVAHRQQTLKESSKEWKVFSAIKIKQNTDDNSLLIHSPFEGSGDWYPMQDIVSINADMQHFKHLGRADKIVKIEEKRLSLTELETQLNLHEYVASSAATVLSGKRSSVAMVVVLNSLGKQYLKEHNKLSLNNCLKSHLKEYFEAVVLPRKWRYNDALPTNAQGKTTQLDLQGMFKQSVNSPKLPTLTQTNIISDNEIELSFNIPENLHYFKGHYPDFPIVPGVVEIDWAIKYAKEYLNLNARFIGMEAVKFHAFITPNDNIMLHLNFKKENRKLLFSFTSKTSKLSSGRILFS